MLSRAKTGGQTEIKKIAAKLTVRLPFQRGADFDHEAASLFGYGVPAASRSPASPANRLKASLQQQTRFMLGFLTTRSEPFDDGLEVGGESRSGLKQAGC
jgi:hypothetical protein